MKLGILLASSLLLASCEAQRDPSRNGGTNPTAESNLILLQNPKQMAATAKRNALDFQAAQQACESRRFEDFLIVFSASQPIREGYAIREISFKQNTIRRVIPIADYYEFPLKTVDGMWFSTGSGMEASNLALSLKFRRGEGENIIVDWRFPPLDPTATWDDYTIDLAKTSGTLSFRMINECWRLVSDHRFG